jgi:hypothetical protein
MAMPPPPYSSITGISRADMKDNAQETIVNYDGNARPGELVVEQNALNLFVGDNNGNLVLLANANATKFYGSFYDNTNQNNDTGNVNYMQLNNTASNNHVSIVNGDEITVDFTGVYDIQFSAQFIQVGGGTHNMEVWLEKNGVTVPDSGGVVTFTGNNTKLVVGWNYVEPLQAGDYVKLVWWSSFSGIDIIALPSEGPGPSVPSVIVSVVQV